MFITYQPHLIVYSVHPSPPPLLFIIIILILFGHFFSTSFPSYPPLGFDITFLFPSLLWLLLIFFNYLFLLPSIIHCHWTLIWLLYLSLIYNLLWYSLGLHQLILPQLDDHLHPTHTLGFWAFNSTCSLLGFWGIFFLGAPDLCPEPLSWVHLLPLFLPTSPSRQFPFGLVPARDFHFSTRALI